MAPVRSISWENNRLRILDQTLLPSKIVYLEIDRVSDLAEAIVHLRVRGAPAIGVAAAFGVVLAALRSSAENMPEFKQHLRHAANLLASTRPTAVNLFWALDRMDGVVDAYPGASIRELAALLEKEAAAILEEDRNVCGRIGEHGAPLLRDGFSVLTHCNAGALATAGIGTALAVIYKAVQSGKTIKVFADETRPLLQGARLTAWELGQAGIDVTVLCDSAAAVILQQKKADCVLVGADRIAPNGDTANKIGTYGLAILAGRHDVPFYVAAPSSTIDFSIQSGREIPIEQRDFREISSGFGVQTVPDGAGIYNPAFDVTPHNLISAFITENGIQRPPFKKKNNP
jgi:methylthioribose-1-phosphate isomerase